MTNDTLTPLFWKRVGLDAARTFIPVFILGVLPVWDSIVSGDWNAAKAAGLAAVAAAGSAVLRGLQAKFTRLETPPELK